jgi:hypothetical protein
MDKIRSLQAHFMLETVHPFRLISYWKRLLLDFGKKVVYSPYTHNQTFMQDLEWQN